MKHPAYHLRLNKAVDRSILVEVLNVMYNDVDRLRGYSYYGLGGPFLEDFRLLAQHFEHLPMTSLEASEHTFRRQKFHRCAKNVELRRETVDSFLTTSTWSKPGVFWLDYTDLEPARVHEFETLLDRAIEKSVVKITLRAALDDLPDLQAQRAISEEESENRRHRYLSDFRARFDSVFPPATRYERLRAGNFPGLLQDMLRIAAQRALPPGSGRQFQILHSCFYSDQTQMYSLTGVVCRDEDVKKFRDSVSHWPLRNLMWREPERIDMPVLSAKERMLLEGHLPAKTATGKGLRKALGYNIDDSEPASVRKLKQYAKFYRYYPQFAKVNVV